MAMMPFSSPALSLIYIEGSQFISLTEQLKRYHPKAHPKIALADSKYDILKNYIYARWNGQIPLFDYNVRNEKLSPKALRERGYDENGWPFGPCTCTLKPNGYDQEDGSLYFACFKQCEKCPALREKMPFCRYYEENKVGARLTYENQRASPTPLGDSSGH